MLKEILSIIKKILKTFLKGSGVKDMKDDMAEAVNTPWNFAKPR